MTVNAFTFEDAVLQFWVAWEKEGRKELTSTGLTYFYLCNIWYHSKMPPTFQRKNTLICAELDISRPTFDRHRAILKKNGLIDFSSTGKGDSNTRYSIVNRPVFEATQRDFIDSNQDETKVEIRENFYASDETEDSTTDVQPGIKKIESEIWDCVFPQGQVVNQEVKPVVNSPHLVKEDVNQVVNPDVKEDVKLEVNVTSFLTTTDSFKNSNESLKNSNESLKDSNDFNNIRILKEEKKDFVVVVKGEIKNFIFFENEFLMDSALQTYCKDQGLAAADFSPALKKWMLLNEKNKYENLHAARKHFMFWLPYHQIKFKQNEYRKQYSANWKNTPPRRKTSEDYAKGL